MPTVVYFLDSSALVKRYIDEAGSWWIQQVLSHPPSAAMAEIGVVEVVAAFARRWRMGEITADEYRFAREVFLRDAGHYQMVPTDRAVIEEATELLDRHPLRAYDALQLATALRLSDVLAEEGLSLTHLRRCPPLFGCRAGGPRHGQPPSVRPNHRRTP